MDARSGSDVGDGETHTWPSRRGVSIDLSAVDGVDRVVVRFDAVALQRCARLTQRECAVLAVLATGVSTNEAARRLRISRDDVRACVQSAQRTLQAHSKLEAMLMALDAGVIDIPPD